MYLYLLTLLYLYIVEETLKEKFPALFHSMLRVVPLSAVQGRGVEELQRDLGAVVPAFTLIKDKIRKNSEEYSADEANGRFVHKGDRGYAKGSERGSGKDYVKGSERGSGKGYAKGSERGSGKDYAKGSERGSGKDYAKGSERGSGKDGDDNSNASFFKDRKNSASQSITTSVNRDRADSEMMLDFADGRRNFRKQQDGIIRSNKFDDGDNDDYDDMDFDDVDNDLDDDGVVKKLKKKGMRKPRFKSKFGKTSRGRTV